MNLPELLLHFDHVKKSGQGKYAGSCPMPDHDDSDPSVSITQDIDTGAILLFCWGCNTGGAQLIEALGLHQRDLFGDPGHPSAVRQMAQDVEVSPEHQADLEQRVKTAMGRLDEAKDYLYNRFNLSVEDGKALGLGVDTDFGVEHLIIPFHDPFGKIVAMQGRRLVDGDPRWRSVSGSGWSKMGCFGWEIHTQGPVIITEGPSDALAVVGRAYLPSLAIRGASNTSPEVCEQIKEWLGDRLAVVIGDNDDAGEKFASAIAEGTGITHWTLPVGYSDLDGYLADGNLLDEALTLAIGAPTPEPAPTPAETDEALKNRIQADFANAIYDEELLTQLNSIPQGRLENIFSSLVAEAGRGQVTDTRNRVTALRRTLRDTARPPARDAGGGNHAPHAPAGDFNPADLPEIIWNAEDQLHTTELHIKDAMDDYEGDDFYRAALGQYIKVVNEDLINLKEPGVKSMLSQMGHWRVINGQRELGHVPTEAAKMISDPSWDCDIRTINRRVDVPFMLENGDIVSTPGFHEDTGIYLLPRSNDPIVVPPVPGVVTDEHVEEAKKIFADAIEGFIFKDHASQTNLVAMTLTSPLRELFRRNPMVPLLTSTAPQSGSGKGTSIRVPLSTAGVGPRSLSTTAYNGDDNEFEKKLVGKLLKKSTYIFLDNIRSQVNSAVLEQMLTAANYDGRTLGYSEVNSLSTLVLWTSTLQSTGSFNRDLTRRCVPVELIKNYRGKWAHKNIDEYLSDMRGPLIWACFVAARKWLQDGSQISEVRLDGYGGWTEVIGGILENVLGYEGFLENLESFRQSQDEVAMTIDGLLERWLTLFGEEECPARAVIEDWDDPALHFMLGLRNPTSIRQVELSLVRQLDNQRGYIISNSHSWEPVGLKQYKHEGMRKLFRAVPLPREEG